MAVKLGLPFFGATLATCIAPRSLKVIRTPAYAHSMSLIQAFCTRTSGGKGTDQQKCLYGNTLHDGYTYVYNLGRGTTGGEHS